MIFNRCYYKISNFVSHQLVGLFQNSITYWNFTIFGNNKNMRRLVLNKNHDYIQLTTPMITDFQQATTMTITLFGFVFFLSTVKCKCINYAKHGKLKLLHDKCCIKRVSIYAVVP